MTEHYAQQIERQLRQIAGLTDRDRDTVLALGLPPYESLVLGYLRGASTLFARDQGFSVLARDRAWANWQAQAFDAIEGAMRFRKNEPLVVAMGVVSCLMPSFFPQATLRGFKALDDALRVAQRSPTLLKRERDERRLHMRDILTRIPVWVNREGDICCEDDLAGKACSLMPQLGYREAWGVGVCYYRPDQVTTLVGAVLDVVWQRIDRGVIIAPAWREATVP